MKKPDNLPPVGMIANRFCEIMAEWGFHFHPHDGRMVNLYTGADNTHPDDVFDANMAMAQAFDEHGIDTDQVLSDGMDNPENNWFWTMWDEAYTEASRNGWLPKWGWQPGWYVLLAYGDGYEPYAVVRSLKDVLGDPSFLPEDKIRLVIPVTGGAKVYDLSDLSGRLYAVRFRVT